MTATPQVADLDLSKSVSDVVPNVGDVVSFTVTVSNGGPDAATGVGVVDVVPDGYSGVANISDGGVVAGGVITWSGLTVAAGGSVELSYEVVVGAPPAGYENTVQVTAVDQFDPDSVPGNDDGDQSEDDETGVGLLPG